MIIRSMKSGGLIIALPFHPHGEDNSMDETKKILEEEKIRLEIYDSRFTHNCSQCAFGFHAGNNFNSDDFPVCGDSVTTAL